MRSALCDIESWQEHRTIAVRPAATGRLKGLVKKTVAGKERVWVFKDAYFKDKDGDERMNHRIRGVVVGSYDEGINFLAMCQSIGLRVEEAGLIVPFSKGGRRGGRFFDGAAADDYTEGELKLVRWDLPTRDQLKEFVAR